MIFQSTKISTVTAVMKDLCRKTEKIRSEPAICVSEITVGTAVLYHAPVACYQYPQGYGPDSYLYRYAKI